MVVPACVPGYFRCFLHHPDAFRAGHTEMAVKILAKEWKRGASTGKVEGKAGGSSQGSEGESGDQRGD